jgi:hypothetical protein
MNASKSAIVTVILLLLGFSLLAEGQTKPLSPEARRLTNALAELQKRPNDPEVQRQYLNVFPRDYRSFLALFDLDRELYDGYKFILVLPSLVKGHEDDEGRLLIDLSKDAHKEADAPTYLQYVTAIYGSQYTKTFATLLEKLPPAEHANLVTFLADVENHAVYTGYQGIIDHLKALGQGDLAKEFELAREKREHRRIAP